MMHLGQYNYTSPYLFHSLLTLPFWPAVYEWSSYYLSLHVNVCQQIRIGVSIISFQLTIKQRPSLWEPSTIDSIIHLEGCTPVSFIFTYRKLSHHRGTCRAHNPPQHPASYRESSKQLLRPFFMDFSILDIGLGTFWSHSRMQCVLSYCFSSSMSSWHAMVEIHSLS